MTTSPKKHHGIARFSAEILWLLEPFVQYTRDQFDYRLLNGNIIVEPCAEGGVMIIAITGHALAVFRDTNGHCSGTVTLDIPDNAFDACNPNKSVKMTSEGERYTLPMPEWAQPGDIWASESGMFIMPKMRHPSWADEDADFYPALYATIASVGSHRIGIDYRSTPDAAIDWRQVLAISSDDEAHPASTLSISPTVFALFKRVHDFIAEKQQNGASCCLHQIEPKTDEKGYPILVNFTGYPDFIGVLMTMRMEASPAVSKWFEKRVGAPIGGVQ